MSTLGWLIQTDCSQMMQPSGSFEILELAAGHAERFADRDRETGDAFGVTGSYEAAKLGRDSKLLFVGTSDESCRGARTSTRPRRAELKTERGPKARVCPVRPALRIQPP